MQVHDLCDGVSATRSDAQGRQGQAACNMEYVKEIVFAISVAEKKHRSSVETQVTSSAKSPEIRVCRYLS